MQTNLPEQMGHALNSLSLLEDKDVKTYPSWDAVVGRFVMIMCVLYGACIYSAVLYKNYSAVLYIVLFYLFSQDAGGPHPVR